jgi:hypothetical protein
MPRGGTLDTEKAVQRRHRKSVAPTRTLCGLEGCC